MRRLAERFGLMFILMPLFFPACSEQNELRDSVREDLYTEFVFYSADPGSSYASSVSARYRIGDVLPVERLIADCMSLNLKKGWRIKSLKYYKNLDSGSADAPGTIVLNPDQTVSSVVVKLDRESFFIGDSERFYTVKVYEPLPEGVVWRFDSEQLIFSSKIARACIWLCNNGETTYHSTKFIVDCADFGSGLYTVFFFHDENDVPETFQFRID